MKKFIFCTVALFLICTLISPVDAPAKGKKFDLSYAGPYFDQHPTVRNAWVHWFQELKEMSGGGITIKYFNPNTLCPENDHFDSTAQGILDIGGQYNGRNPGKFPIGEVMELPLIAPSAEAGSLVTWDLYEKYPEWRAEYEGVKMLWQWTSATYQLHTTKKLVKSLEDLKGMKIICWSPKLLEMMRSLGASPIQVAPPDTYLALQRGMADGVLCPLAPVRSYKITDAVKFHTIVDLCVGPFWTAMNPELWESMPGDIQNMFAETTGRKMTIASGQTLDAGAVEDAQWMKENGHTFHLLADTERERWIEKLNYMRGDWVKNMEARGVADARAILEDAVALGQKYAETTGRGYKE